MEHTKGKWETGKRSSVCYEREIAQLQQQRDALLETCKRDAELANAAISATPTGKYRNKLTEINILRLQAIAKAEEG